MCAVDAPRSFGCTARVKTDVAPPPARYRNEAVFRSAELLIASKPKPAARQFPRWLVFVTGLLVGVGATIAVLRSRATITPVSADAPAPVEPPLIAASLTRFFGERTIRGHLLSEAALPVSVEFTVQLLPSGAGNKLTGVVRYLNRNVSVAEHGLEGEIHDHTLTLRETVRLSSAKGTPTAIGRTFELQVPDDAARFGRRFGGTWSFGAQSGTLSAIVTTPW